MSSQRVLTSIIVLILTNSAAPHAHGETNAPSWKSKDGRVIQAKFVKLDGDAVVLEKDGKQFPVPVAKLDATSLDQARKLATAVDGTFLIPVPQDHPGKLVIEPSTHGGRITPLGLAAVPPELASADNIVRLSVEGNHALALTSAGKVFAWGHKADDRTPPSTEMNGGKSRVVDILSTGRFDVVLLEDGSVLGNAAAKMDTKGQSIRRIAGWPPHVYGFDENDQIYYFGDSPDRAVPPDVQGVAISDLKASETNTMALSKSGNVFVWGSNSGNITTLPDELKRRISKGEKVRAISGCQDHMALVVMESGKLFDWGNGLEQIGTRVTTANNPLAIWYLPKGPHTFIIQRQQGDVIGYEFHHHSAFAVDHYKKILRRHQPLVLGCGTDAMVMIVPSAGK